jgi:ankyrin repeat protein
METRDSQGQTLLHRAVECRLSEDALRFLISKRLPLDQKDIKGYTALDRALSSSFTEYFNILIQSGACQASPTLAVKFYNQFIKDSSDPVLIRNFKILEERHQQIRWRMILERCLPRHKPKTEVSEVIQGAREGCRFLPD